MIRAVHEVGVACLILGCFAGPSPAAAQGTPADHWVVDTLRSKQLGLREIYIALPEEYVSGTDRYPLLVLLDANDLTMFRLWITQAAYLADNDPGVPPVIVVGIVNGDDRIHDMTPPPVGSSVARFKNGGGAEAFANFIRGEVLPWVRANYRTAPTTILAGHSAGGLFALDVAANWPGSFQGVIALSPALWYNDSLPARAFADAIARSSARQRVFVSSGGIGEPDIDITSQRFVQRLDSLQPATVAVGYRRYPEDTHSLTGLNFADGFRFVFDPVLFRRLPIAAIDTRTVDSTTLSTALTTSERIYADSARRLLLPEQLPERALNSLGYRLLGRKPSLAVWVFRENIRRYPNSVNVYDSYADGLLATGDTAMAITELRRAVEVGRQTGAPVAAETRDKLARLLAKH